MTALIESSIELRSAIAAKAPVVALESTVIAHGLPRPQNLETARRLEQIVRAGGALPVTIGMIGGKLRAGLNETELESFANDNDIKKLSVRDLAVGVAKQWHGATTVASTMWIGHRAGIDVFATGGIGDRKSVV